MPPLSLWTRHAKQYVCRCSCSRVVIQHPKHQPHRCAHSQAASHSTQSPRAPPSVATRDDGLVLFRITEISSVRLSSISVTPKPAKPHKKHRLARSANIFSSSMRSLHMAKDKLKAKLHGVGIAGTSPSTTSGSGGSSCRPARAFSSDSAHYNSDSRQTRSNSLGKGVFRPRRGSGGHRGGKGPVPLTPSPSMIFIDCPE